MENMENGRMILNSVQNGPLIWPTVTDADGTTRTKKYEELSATEKIQADYDCKLTNIVLQGLPPDVYAIFNHHKDEKEIWDRGETLYQYYWRFAQLINNMNVINMLMSAVQVNTKFLNSLPPEWSLVIPVFNPGDDLIACLNKAIAFLTAIASLRFPSTNNQLRTSSNLRNQATIQDDRVTMQQVQGRQGQSYVDNSYKGIATSLGRNNTGWRARVTEDLDAYDSDCDDVSNVKAVLMAYLSSYSSDVLSEVPYSDSYHNDMDNQSVHAMQDFEQTPIIDFSDNEITSDSNIILYSQYLQETQLAAVQDTNLYAQQDSMILSMIEQMSKQMINLVNNWGKANQKKNNESVTAELERYKERVKTIEQRLNVDLSTREKMIDSQMDDMMKEKLALKQQIDSLEQNLSNQIKENESLLQIFTVFKNESKEKKNKYIDKEIDLEKKIKELDNIVNKVGYQILFYLKKAQWIKPTLYDGSVISDKHVSSPIFNDEETLILEEVSRSKMLAKQNYPISKEKKVNTTPINYAELNRLSEDFGKHFVPQQELSDEQAFWLQTPHPNTDQSTFSLVKIEAPRELPKVSLVNTSLKKLKYHLGQFDTVVKKRITPDALTEGEWGFEHTKVVFLNEIIPFLKTLKDIFNVFDKDLLNECVDLDDELLNKQSAYNDLSKSYSQLEKHCISLELSMQLNQEIFQKDSLSNNQNSFEIPEYFENNDLKAQLQAKDTTISLNSRQGFVITSLKNDLQKLKEKEVENAVQIPIATIVYPDMFKLDLDPLAPSHRKAKSKIFGNLQVPPNNIVPLKETTYNSVETPKLETKVYSRRPKQIKIVGSSKKAKIIESKIANNLEPNHLWGSNATDVPSSSSLVNDRNDQVVKIMGYGDYQLGNVIISRVYYVEGLGYNLLSVGQFYDADLEVAFRKNTYYIRHLKGVDLLSGSRDTNLYTISLDDMLNTSPIYLLSNASKTKSWLWHRRLSHLNFGTLNKLAKDVRNVRTDNKTEFVNQTLCDFYENVSISHQTSVARTPQQNGVVERQNRTLVEATRTMLILSKAPLFLWAEAINTACYTQNCSLIRLRYNKTPYELMHDKKPDLSFLHVFGSLCYPTKDSKDLGKLNAKEDIDIFVGYASTKKAFRIYNKRTQKIMETIHVTFDELTAMASE
ncbi:retrovirus-related pol polyprotein from transposon TNT 1-94 [Tanacetum coccineum]